MCRATNICRRDFKLFHQPIKLLGAPFGRKTKKVYGLYIQIALGSFTKWSDF
jgi:hypothetical protein